MRKVCSIMIIFFVASILPLASSAGEKHGKKSAKEICEATATRDKVSADKKNAYIKICIEKHGAKKKSHH